MATIRRFVNIVAEKYRTGVYSLHRLEVSKHLFYPSTPQEQANTGGGADPPATELLELPAPCVRIQPDPQTNTPRYLTDVFGLVSPRRNEGRIVFINKIRHTLLVHADTSTIRRMPDIKGDKGNVPILISLPPPDAQDQLEEDLYIMNRRPTRHMPGFLSNFDVLKLGSSGEPSKQWLDLPPPPFVDNPWYDDTKNRAIILSHAVVDGGRTICVSFDKDVGTYCFDRALCSWRHLGDWILPFDGCAEYVPNLNIWLGIPLGTPEELCWTSELSGMPMEQPPELQHVWRDSVVTPENWSPMMSTLVNLGSGRFCIYKLFEINKRSTSAGDYYYDYFYPEVNNEVAVLTGIEICSGKEGPKVLKHKSIIYHFVDDAIRWVL